MEEIDRLRAIVEQARGVRDLQKRYFKTKQLAVLQESKTAERVLDKMLADYNPNAPANQASFFG